MPRVCTICTHPERAAIDKSLAGNESNRDVSRRFGPSIPALQRHRAHHLPQVLARAQQRVRQRQEAAHADGVGAVAQQRQEQEQAQALDVIRQLKAINGASLQILNEARQTGNSELALKAVDRVQRQVELQAKLLGELDERPQVNVLLAPEWLTVRTTLLTALGPYPEARAAVAAQLIALEGSNGHNG